MAKAFNNKIAQQIGNVKLFDVYKERFKRGDYSFITEGLNDKGKRVKHKKQDKALKILMSNKYEEFLYGGAAGGAKGLSINELVLTPFGFKEIRHLKIGENICATDGTIQQVINKVDNGVIPFYRITFADGTFIDCDYSHLWLAWVNRKKRKINNKPTFGEDSVRKYTTEDMYSKFKEKGYRFSIPLTEPVSFNVAGSLYGAGNFVKRDLDAYTLGVLLGDGCLRHNRVNFHTPDHEIAERIKQKHKVSYSKTKGRELEQGVYSFIGETGRVVKDYLTTVKLMEKYSYEKFIPKIYLHGSIQERWDLLNGLMDTDGYADEDGDSFYSTSSEKLADDVTYLARSLGCFVSMKVDENPFYRDENGEKVFCRASYTLRIKSKTPEKLFWLPRKRDRVKDKVHQHYGNTIVNIEKIEDKQSICISVSHPNSLFITKDFHVTHNSWTGCVWLLFMSQIYPKTKYFIARNELKDIVDSVWVTFQKVCDAYGFTDYTFNANKNFIKFGNGSMINFVEISLKPRDPEFNELGSTEYTCGWIEEATGVVSKGAHTLMTRVGRHLNDVDEKGRKRRHQIKGITFLTGNPGQSWTKTDYYDLAREGKLEDYKCYLPCLITENPFIPSDYIEKQKRLASKDKSMYERLFLGNWEFEDNPNKLCDYEALQQIFDNDHVEQGKTYLTADIARLGADKAVICVWRGWRLIEIIEYKLSLTTQIQNSIFLLRKKYGIPKHRCVGDADGIGGGVIDNTGIKEFNNGGAVLREGKDTPNYRNLQVQCLYHLAERINNGDFWIMADVNSTQKKEIIEELNQIESKVGDYGKLDVKRKSEIKLSIGRSPDYRDAILMRVFFDLKKPVLNLTTNWR